MRTILALAALALVVAGADAGSGRHRRQSCPGYSCGSGQQQCCQPGCPGGACGQPSSPLYADYGTPRPAPAGPSAQASSALDEVNATRAQRGLRPFLPDPQLDQAAQACAQARASRLCSGHLPEGDFRYLPPGANAAAAGCAAWTPDWGWGACCTYDNYTFAGAGVVMGGDGRRYMHLFVR
jgi:hypothetical protein